MGFTRRSWKAWHRWALSPAKFMSQSPLYQLYPDVNWAELFTKLGNLLRQEYDWSEGAAALRPPLMLIYADADAISTARIGVFGLLGGGRRDAGMDGFT